MARETFVCLLLAAICLIAGCSSSTDLIHTSGALKKGDSYAEIILQTESENCGIIMATSTQASGSWDKIQSNSSTAGATGKMLYALTPWGMLTNAANGKDLFVTRCVYRVPVGNTRLIVFNYHSRAASAPVASSPLARADQPQTQQRRYYSWVNIVTADLEPRKQYKLCTKSMRTGVTEPENVPAYALMRNEEKSNVVSAIRFVEAKQGGNFKTGLFTRETYNLLADPHNPVRQGVSSGYEATAILDLYGAWEQELKDRFKGP
ncbi:MAG: hypothetical protein JW720_12480 [Sedimentisphaerales bacterium]|nr:hypothetical protein [Sedimentisphaerales bacterium]